MTILRHGLTAADQGAMTTLRARLAARPVAITRASYDALLEQVPSADSVSYTEASIGGVPGVWCAPSTSPGKAAVLYLHWIEVRSCAHCQTLIAAKRSSPEPASV